MDRKINVLKAFGVATEGLDGAMHALRPLGLTTAAAVVLAVLLRLTIFRRVS